MFLFTSQRRKLTKNSTRLVIVLVGLPARGKSFVARKLEAHMNWSGARCKIFNVGRYRRQAYAELQAKQENDQEKHNDGACSADFFDPNNTEASQLREHVAEVALRDMLNWLDGYQSSQSFDEATMLEESERGGEDFSSRHMSTDIASMLQDLKDKKDQHGRVAIFDATNSTTKRRKWILEECTSVEKRGDKPTGVVFVESYCDDKELLEENYRYKVTNSPDYVGMSEEEAMEDLRKRVQKYESQYETITDDSYSYIKVFNLSTKLLVNHIYGRMAKDLVPALMAWNIGTRPVYLCRPGQTISGLQTDGEDYVAPNSDLLNSLDPRLLDMSSRTRKKSLRGDGLGEQGKRFRQALLAYLYGEVHGFMQKRRSVHDMANTGTSISGLQPLVGSNLRTVSVGSLGSTSADDSSAFHLKVLTSTLPRAVDTVRWDGVDLPIGEISNLNPLDKGDFAGMELGEIRIKNPKWYSRLENDPFGTRFPGGESYRDLVRRLVSVVIDIEQQVIPTLVVSHVSILQCLVAYFRNTPVSKCTEIVIPMHTVLKFEPVRGGGWSETQVPMSTQGTPEVNQTMVTESEKDSRQKSQLSPIWSDPKRSL